MKFFELCVVLLLCVVLTANPYTSFEINEDQEINAINAALPAISGLIGMCVTTAPLGPILVASLGLMHVASMIMTGGGDDDESSNALTNIDLIKSQSVILNAIDRLGGKMMDQSEKLLRELKHVIQKTQMMESMRLDLGSMERAHVDKMKALMDPKKTGVQKNATIAGLLDNDSNFMERLRAFIDRYIKPRVILASADEIKLFYELTLENDRLLALENKDNYQDSTSNRIFKSYMYICKTLTEAYVLPIVAHALQYQSEMKRGLISDAQSTKSNADDLIEYYKNDMKALAEKTKWALNNASREIRNAPVFKLKKGVTFERLSFASTFPRIFYSNGYGCSEEKSVLNIKDYQVGNCNSYGDIIPPKSQVSVYYNPDDLERPYQYMTVKTPKGEEETFGHESSDSSLNEHEFTVQDQCPFSLCPIYKKNAVAISTQRVSAEPGNVITGARFRLEDGVIYIDIQQGKFEDILSVEPNVHWKETPAGGPVQYLSSTANRLELGDFEVDDKSYLTSIQIVPGRGRYGSTHFEIKVGGASGPQWLNFGVQGSGKSFVETNELRVPEADDAEKAVIDTKNLISQPPKEGERYFITLQPSDIKKDLGRSSYPLIDIRPVVSNPPAPMRGFGIYHTNVGLLSLKMITPKLDHLADYKLNEALLETKA
ncbi:uncharacterized protein LOC129946824 [Eupeodes corollae]|uniref:uncharacterized protein LOC129946824 n=1 Tax=Eupeodes corollae TaxID=290404 RepID=UPI00249092F2|nr:uncharacterized protein LOC129946824 [Eupeodes corollae]